MEKEAFEAILNRLVSRLTAESREELFEKSKPFEDRVRRVLQDLLPEGIEVNFDPHPYVFPDIVLGEYGIEVKFTTQDTWRSVANSIFETTRDGNVKYVYLVFGKMGGTAEVKWGRYEECVMHVRTSHVPRFEVAMEERDSLFNKFGVTYEEFCRLSEHEKMLHIRQYARGRLKSGERLWWLEDKAEQDHSLSLEVKLYMNLDQDTKRRLRAEAALLCPQVLKKSRAKKKYEDAATYLLTYHGVLCTQARDLFSAGSVAMRADQTRGGNYIERALSDIEDEMRQAAATLDDALFVEYWGISVNPPDRIEKWLQMADEHASDWVPSKSLFKKRS